ncbi:MAG: hypothetical protein ACRD4Q_15890, partial [Candidatus Acidiferrales bacterium]
MDTVYRLAFRDRVKRYFGSITSFRLRDFMLASRISLCGVFILFAAALPAATAAPAAKPPLTLTQFFSAASIGPVQISPDGRSVVVETRRADWAKSIFRRDLWLYRAGAGIIPLTQSERDFDPQWSPDGRWIA